MKVIIEIEPHTIEISVPDDTDYGLLEDLVWDTVKDRVEYTYTTRDDDA